MKLEVSNKKNFGNHIRMWKLNSKLTPEQLMIKEKNKKILRHLEMYKMEKQHIKIYEIQRKQP